MVKQEVGEQERGGGGGRREEERSQGERGEESKESEWRVGVQAEGG